MNKNDLVGAVADASGLTKADSGKAVDAAFDAITKLLSRAAKFVWSVSAHSRLPSVKLRPAVIHAPVKK
jgi:Bacterial DNA-binding protein